MEAGAYLVLFLIVQFVCFKSACVREKSISEEGCEISEYSLFLIFIKL